MTDDASGWEIDLSLLARIHRRVVVSLPERG